MRYAWNATVLSLSIRIHDNKVVAPYAGTTGSDKESRPHCRVAQRKVSEDRCQPRPAVVPTSPYEKCWINHPINTTCGVEISGSASVARQERVVARRLITSV